MVKNNGIWFVVFQFTHRGYPAPAGYVAIILDGEGVDGDVTIRTTAVVIRPTTAVLVHKQ